jgi:perosamine synthetase
MSDARSSLGMLAIDGGRPVRPKLLPYGHQNIDETDIEAVVQVLRSEWLTTGPKVAEFEQAFAAWVGAKYAVSFSSGTAALHGAAFAASLGPGDEAITSPLTFAATANCVLYQGARPVFADIQRDTLNLNPAEVERHLTPKTKAILPVDYCGHPADLNEILRIADTRGLVVIEDGCHALGAEYHGRRVGGISPLTVFSFHPVKHIATGEGGMVTTDSRPMADKLRSFRNHGFSSDARQRQASGEWFYEMRALGFNYRLTDIACALGLSQLKKLAANLARRREIAARYTSAFAGLPLTLPTVTADANPSWHLYAVRVDLGRLTVDRAQIFRALRAENIGVNVHYIPVHLHPYYQDKLGDQTGAFPVAESAYQRLLSLPIFYGMTDRDVEDVVTAVIKVMAAYSR